MLLIERLELTVMVMEDAYRSGESKFLRPVCDNQRVFRISDAVSQYCIHGYLKISIVGKQLQLR